MLQSQSSPAITVNGKSSIHILHIDDDPSIREISKQILLDMDSSFVIDAASCVAEAFKKLENGQYDVVISDYDMPQKDGLQFLKELREQGNEIPFILFTGKGREEVAVKALNLGSDAYINKQGNLETVYGELSHSIVKIIERKNSKKLLVESESKYLRLFNSSEVGMFRTKKRSFEIVDSNEKLLQILGYSREEIQGTSSTIYFGDAAQQQEWVKIFQAKGQVVDFEIKLVSKKGEIKTCLLSAKLSPEQETVEGSIVDVTERKKAEQALIQSEANYRNLINGMDESVWVIDFDGNFIDFNNAAIEMLGYSKEELRSLGIRGIDNYLNQEQVKNLIRRVALGQTQIFETMHTTKDGFRIPVEISSSLVVYQGKQAILAIARNITERKKVEEKLILNERKYRDFADSLPEIIFETDEKGTVTFLNKRGSEILGFTLDEIRQRKTVEILVPEDQQRAVQNVRRRMRDESPKGNEYRLRKKDGSTFPVMIFSEKIINNDGKIGLRGVIVNISESRQKAEELKRLSEKLSVLGSLTRHDVRNKLSCIRGCTYLMKKRFSDNDELRKLIDQIDSAVDSTAHLLDFAAVYEKVGAEPSAIMNIGKCFTEASNAFPDLRKIEIKNECDSLELTADSLLKQLFYNFIDNSLNHGEKVTQIKLHYKREDDRMRLFYEDNGVGILDSNKPKLFREGFSTGKSTGLGLFLIKKMVETYGWTISEEGEPSKGAKFVITAPTRR